MKLKYYMRGIGIGVIVTTIILVITFAFSGNNISDEEIINRAKKLGMVESSKTMTNSTTNSTTNTTNSTNTTEGNQTIPGATNPMPDNNSTNSSSATNVNNDSVDFTISENDVSRTVIERLAQQGLISDAAAFNKYLNDKGLDNNLQNGTFKIKRGISEEELANLLVTKQQFREH